MQNAITEIKNSLESANSRIQEAEDGISEVEDRLVEMMDTEQKREKRLKRNEESLRELWDNIKHTNIRIIGVPKGEERAKETENIFQEIIAENFPIYRLLYQNFRYLQTKNLQLIHKQIRKINSIQY